MAYSMSASKGAPNRDANDNENGDGDGWNDGDARDAFKAGEGDRMFARFREFTASGGDNVLQDELVREVMWQATQAATTETLESAIKMEIDSVSDLLSEMYTRGERDIVQRNEELARRTSLPNISKWNQQLIKGHKASKIRRSEISKELAIVDAMLKRSARQRNRSRRSRPTTRRYSLGNPSPTASAPSTAAATSNSRPDRRKGILQINGHNALIFTLFVCVLALQSFEKISARENGPSQLANCAVISSVVMVSCAYMNSLHAAYRKANDELY